MTLGVLVGALLPQPRRKDVCIYGQESWYLHWPSTALSNRLSKSGTAPVSVTAATRTTRGTSQALSSGEKLPSAVSHPSSFGARQSSTRGSRAVQLTRSEYWRSPQTSAGRPLRSPPWDGPHWDTPPPQHSLVLLVSQLPLRCPHRLTSGHFRAEHSGVALITR